MQVHMCGAHSEFEFRRHVQSCNSRARQKWRIQKYVSSSLCSVTHILLAHISATYLEVYMWSTHFLLRHETKMRFVEVYLCENDLWRCLKNLMSVDSNAGQWRIPYSAQRFLIKNHFFVSIVKSRVI